MVSSLFYLDRADAQFFGGLEVAADVIEEHGLCWCDLQSIQAGVVDARVWLPYSLNT